MTMTSRNIHQEREADVDMTPMLDIVFILLIFFIVTTSFVREEGLLVNRPKAKNNPTDNNNPTVVVQISETGLVKFNGQLVDIERLSARIESFLSENQTNSAVVIAHDDVTHERVVKVIDSISSFKQLTIAIGK
jgi:biopolymer transport protein ExbD